MTRDWVGWRSAGSVPGMERRPVIVPEDRNGAAVRRSWSRAIAGHVLNRTSGRSVDAIIKAAWPRDERAGLIAKGAVSPTSRADFPARDVVQSFRSLAPGSAALKLFELGLTLDLRGAMTIRIPSLTGLPLQPLFVAEGAPAPATQWSFASTVVGPGRKILLLSAVTSELNDATPETASAVIGRVLADCADRSIDIAAFGTQADDGVTPARLLHSVNAHHRRRSGF